jgi:hypothetical protein
VHIHLDRLLVEGLPAGEKQAFLRALEERMRALAADVATEGMNRSQRIVKVDAGVMRGLGGAETAAGQVVKAVRRALAPGGSAGKMRPMGAGMPGKGAGRG